MLADVPVYRDSLGMQMDAKGNNNTFGGISSSPTSDDTNSRTGPNTSPSLELNLMDPEPMDSVMNEPTVSDYVEAVPEAPKPKKKSQQRSIVCEFVEENKPQCKQRAILSYRYCIRHILNDKEAPYKRCDFMIKNKTQCTNAIKNELNNIYCSTHLIKMGEKEAKRRKKPLEPTPSEGRGSSIASPLTQDDALNMSFDSSDTHSTKESPRYPSMNGRPNQRSLPLPNSAHFQQPHSEQFPQSSRAPEEDLQQQNPRFRNEQGNVVVQKYPHHLEHLHRMHQQHKEKPAPIRYPLEFISCKVPSVYYDQRVLEVDEKEDEVEKLRRDYLNEKSEKRRVQRKEVQLSHKCRNVSIKGPFRAIHTIDGLCSQIEGSDFDNADLFSLGFEPSDSESNSSDDEDVLPTLHMDPRNYTDCRLNLYLLKKRLKRESEKLQKHAKMSVNVLNSVKTFPDTVGHIFKMRSVIKKRRNIEGVTAGLRKCFYMDRTTRRKCHNIVVPRSSMCMEHIGYSLEQKAYSFCNFPCCGKPVLKLDALLTQGKCEEHHLSQQPDRAPPPVNGYRPPSHAPQPVQNGQPPSRIPPPSYNQQNGHHPAEIQHRRRTESDNDTSGDRHLMNSIMDDFDVTDVVDEDVSLSSVANEICMFDNLNDMFAHLPDDDQHNENGAEMDDNGLLNVLNGVDESDGDMGHSWADISEFLRSEGYSADHH